MGARLVGEAFRFATEHKLGDTDMRLLLWMCHRALDHGSPSGQEPGFSFMRRSELALGLGRLMHDGRDQAMAADDLKDWKAHDQALTRALKHLVDCGAIDRVSRGRQGRTATYELVLNMRSEREP